MYTKSSGQVPPTVIGIPLETRSEDLFLVRVENGRYHVVRDWWRSIFPIHSGSHPRLPLDETSPSWERVGLMSWWVRPDRAKAFEDIATNDPGGALACSTSMH